MGNPNIITFSKEYEYLIPDRLQGLLIILLNEKIRAGEIGEEFTQIDIKYAITEVTQLIEVPNTPNVERITKDLLHYFIERSLGNSSNKFSLTEYAKRFIRLIDNKINNPHKQFPLKETFNKYLHFKSEDIKSIEDFIQWHALGFASASKETIVQHLEGFQDEVDSSIDNLKIILNSKENEAMEMVKKFVDVFMNLGEKASQLAEALDFKNETLLEIRKCVDRFYNPIKNLPHATSEIERKAFRKFDTDWRKALGIHNEVKSFFLRIDLRLEVIKTQILFASSKLTELQENFKIQSIFKIKLRKLLRITLESSKFTREALTLNNNFPRVSIPFESFRFMAISYYDFGQISSQEVQGRYLDEEYHKKELEKIEQEFVRQEKTEEWFVSLKQTLSNDNEINYENYFFKILKAERDIEIPLQVGFELLQYANKSPKHEIEINRIMHEDEEHKDVSIWKMKIKIQKTNITS